EVGKCRAIRPRSRHCNRLKFREPGYPPSPPWLGLLRERVRLQSDPGARRDFLFAPFSRLKFLSGSFVRHIVSYLARHFAVFAAGLILLGGPLRAQSTAPQVPAPAMREVIDEYGRTVRIPQTPLRIVSLAPSLTETLYALGVQDRLVGDTDYCDYPPEAQKKTKVGGVVNPNFEEIAALHPDLVLLQKEGTRIETVRALETWAIPPYATDAHSVGEITPSTKNLADLVGVPDPAKPPTADLRARLATLHSRLESTAPSR